MWPLENTVPVLEKANHSIPTQSSVPGNAHRTKSSDLKQTTMSVAAAFTYSGPNDNESDLKADSGAY